MGRELTSRLATESFRCISKSFCASQTTGLWARQGGQMVRAQDMQSGGPSLHLQHCPDLFLGISSLQLNILATLVMANRPFPSSKKFRFQNEAKCETFVVKMSFICIIIKDHFHINGFALSLALKVRFFGTRKWHIGLSPTSWISSEWSERWTCNPKNLSSNPALTTRWIYDW